MSQETDNRRRTNVKGDGFSQSHTIVIVECAALKTQVINVYVYVQRVVYPQSTALALMKLLSSGCEYLMRMRVFVRQFITFLISFTFLTLLANLFHLLTPVSFYSSTGNNRYSIAILIVSWTFFLHHHYWHSILLPKTHWQQIIIIKIIIVIIKLK